MTNKLRWVGIAAGAVLAGGLLLAQGPGPGMMGILGDFQARHLEALSLVLGLTDAQKAQAKGIFDAAWEAAKPLLPELRQAHEALVKAVESGSASDQQIQQLADTQAKLISQLIAIHAKAAIKFRALLTPEQRDKADKLRGLMRPSMAGAMRMLHHRAGAPQ